MAIGGSADKDMRASLRAWSARGSGTPATPYRRPLKPRSPPGQGAWRRDQKREKSRFSASRPSRRFLGPGTPSPACGRRWREAPDEGLFSMPCAPGHPSPQPSPASGRGGQFRRRARLVRDPAADARTAPAARSASVSPVGNRRAMRTGASPGRVCAQAAAKVMRRQKETLWEAAISPCAANNFSFEKKSLKIGSRLTNVA